MKFRQILLFIVLLLTSCFVSFSLFAQTTTGMIAYFKFNGNTTNFGSASITATPIGASYTTNNAGATNSAIQLAGTTGSYIDFVDNGNLDFSGATNFTISFSFYAGAAATAGLIDNCLNYNGWGVWFWSTLAGTWNIQFNYKGNSVGSPAGSNFTLGHWHHLAIVRNGTTISIYIDGVFRMSGSEGTNAPTYPINMAAGAMTFSSFSPPRYNPLNGKIDELRIYNRALSATEIAQLTPFALPLKLGDLIATKKPNGVQLNWETLSEENTARFEIERSIDGNQFSSIGSVSAAGNSSTTRLYSYFDTQVPSRTVFYRLKMIDLDGGFQYSRVVAIKNESLLTLEVFPNPATDVIQLQLAAEQKTVATISVIDASGKRVRAQTSQLNEGTNAISIPVQDLSSGNYAVIIDDGNRRRTALFIKR